MKPTKKMIKEAMRLYVGQSDLKGRNLRELIGEEKLLGISAATVEEAVAAQKAGADYIGVGAVFATSTKKDAKNLTLEQVKAICDAVSIPVVAIGGIEPENLLKLSGSGVDGVAVISAIFAAKDPKAATARLLALTERMAEHG